MDVQPNVTGTLDRDDVIAAPWSHSLSIEIRESVRRYGFGYLLWDEQAQNLAVYGGIRAATG